MHGDTADSFIRSELPAYLASIFLNLAPPVCNGTLSTLSLHVPNWNSPRESAHRNLRIIAR